MSDDPDDRGDPEDGTVLSPDELDITNEENVTEIGEGRYVISPGDGPPSVPAVDEMTPDLDDRDPARPDDLTVDDIHDRLASRLESSSSEYAFDVTARFEGRVEQNALFSNDVVATFESLMTWYAQHAGGETPVEDVLGLLLLESNLPIRFPTESLAAFVEASDLDDADSIAALYEAAEDAGGLTLEPGN